MLVLIRKVGERIVIGKPDSELFGTIEVTEISKSKGDEEVRVKLGFTFPRSINIVRSELRKNE